MKVVEGISGTWFYHLAVEDGDAMAFCGARIMPTNISLSAWGYAGHLNERWCQTCGDLITLQPSEPEREER